VRQPVGLSFFVVKKQKGHKKVKNIFMSAKPLEKEIAK